MYFAYILQSEKTSRYYTGSTAELDSRLKKHNNGDTVSTRNGAPLLLKVKVHPSSKREEVIRKAVDTIEIFVRAKAIGGKANDAAILSLIKFLNLPRSRVRIVRGAKSHNKLVEVID